MNCLRLLLLIAFLSTIQFSYADVRLPTVFGPHMVLQRKKPVPVWGWADAGEKVTVTFNNQLKTGKADKAGKWMLLLDPMEAGGPFVLTVKGKKNEITLDDVLLGDVWVCSGQSNMEWPLANVNNAKAELMAANYPTIRQFLAKKSLSLVPKDDVAGNWSVCSPETAARFTAVGYFFARSLQTELNVPIGLVNTTWGGTHVETWTSREGLAKDPELATATVNAPTTDDAMRQSGQQRIARLLTKTQNGQLPTPAEALTWAAPDLDTHDWLTMNMPGDWQWSGLPEFDGVVWFRREVTVADNVMPKNVTLRLGPSDDVDSVFVNGQFVGSTCGYSLRNYTLPDGLLKPGRNVIAVRVNDTGGQGGLMGSSGQLGLTGTNIDESLAGKWQYRVAQVHPTSYVAGPNTYGSLLFNAMVHPLIPYAIEGVIWYQGESNADRASQYRRAFPLLIRDWRQQWSTAMPSTVKPNPSADFPFLFVQLANFGTADNSRGSNWAELREAQTMALSLPNTGMAVTSDIGNPSDIHPRNKQDVGKRLAAEALRVAYGKALVSAGPLYDARTMTGNQVRLTFKNVGMGLVAHDKYGYLKGFQIAGTDQKFYFAKAEIKGDAVVLSSDSVATPVAVRYGWANDNGEANLFNKEGFPAVPFRTDAWRGVTEGVKFEQ